MDVFLEITYWAYQPRIWIIIGVLFILLEFTDGSTIFFLPMGISSHFVALLIYLVDESILPLNFIPSSWYWLIVYWMSFSVLTAIILTRIQRLKKSRFPARDDDVNSY